MILKFSYMAYRQFAEGLDVLTTEIEHVSAEGLSRVAALHNVHVEPAPGTLALIQVIYSMVWSLHNLQSRSIICQT